MGWRSYEISGLEYLAAGTYSCRNKTLVADQDAFPHQEGSWLNVESIGYGMLRMQALPGT